MPRDICNKEITINEKEKNLLESQEPFHLIFVKQTYRKSFKKCKQMTWLKRRWKWDQEGGKKLIKTTPSQAKIISY